MYRKKSANIFTGLLALFQLALPASANSLDVDEIVVSAARTPLQLNQVGSAATIITRDQIEARQARNITDLLRSVPGFSISHAGVVGSQAQIRVRGAEANHVLVLVDGVRVNDPATGDEFRWEHLSTGNIERVEIVRGPQSALWGSDAVAAVVHVITRSGSNGGNVDAYVEVGSFDTANVGVNGTLGNERWSMAGAIEQLNTDGSNISRSGNEKDDADLTTASLNVGLRASDSVSFDAGIRAIDAYSQFDPVDFSLTGLPTDADRATETDNLYLHASSKIAPTDSRLSHQISVRYFESDNRNLVDNVEGSSTASERVSLTYQTDIQLGDNSLSLALEHEKTDFEQTGAIVFGDPNQQQSTDINSAVAEYRWLAADRLTLIVGARFDDNSDFDDSLNGRLSAAYQFTDNATLRASVGTGQKNPTFTELFGFFPGQFVGNPGLKPELSTSYDVGLDVNLLDDSLQLQFSVFHQDLQDEVITVFDSVTFFASPDNAAFDSERDGIEMTANLRISEHFGIAAHYTYTDATERTSASSRSSELRRPKHSAGASANISGNDNRWSASLNADYGGTRTDIFFPPFPDPSEIVTLSNYWLLDLALQYRATDAITVFARGSNLLDDDYEQVFGYRTLGRAGYIGARMNFGQ